MNRLAQETSPYLRQHAGNPVDWYPWSGEALETARRLDRPILLSIGYSACHWCHVMERESFEDPVIARRMNEGFVCIKVDREERPDLDQLYQGAAQLLGRGGGWPLTVLLTPERRPFFAGTYFPPVNRGGLPAFSRVLDELARVWREERGEVEAQARALTSELEQVSSFGLGAAAEEIGQAEVVAAARVLEREIDPVNGGFGMAPKFPMASALALLLRGGRRAKDRDLVRPVLTTLERMAEGGLYDQLGGGFHRYSVDAQWQVPHFEKMLYDNALLLHLLAEAEQVEPRPLWRKVARETAEYVRREMTAPGGGFYATQDADSEGVEGKFFVWTPEQLEEQLPPELLDLAKAHFGVFGGGNFEGGTTVLHIERDAAWLARSRGLPQERLEAELEEIRGLLFAAREKRVKPGRDEKILAGWNGLMIRGLAFAARVFQRPEWASLAKGAADFALETLWRDGRLRRSEHQDTAFLEDYGDLAAGLCALYQATFEDRYLGAARELAAEAVRRFWDAGKQAYRTAPLCQADLLLAGYALFDEAVPSGASMLTEAQVALAALGEEPSFLDQAGRYLARLHEQASKSPLGFAHLWLAADAWLDGAAEVTLVGGEDERRPFLDAIAHTYAPTVAVRAGPAGQGAAAIFCRRFSCLPPFTRAEDLRRALAD